jgi:hypothetical protein
MITSWNFKHRIWKYFNFYFVSQELLEDVYICIS